MALEFDGFGEIETPKSGIRDLKANGQMQDIQGPTQEQLDKLPKDENGFLPMGLTDAEAWENYTNNELYQLDKMIRGWLKRSWYHRQVKGKMRTAVPILFAYFFGRSPTPEDSYTCRLMHKLLKYYCTRYTGKSTIHYQEFSRVYYFSQYSCKNRKPYSLRLCMEEIEDGKDPFRASTEARRDKTKYPRRMHSKNGKKQNGLGRNCFGHGTESDVPKRSKERGSTSGGEDVH